MAPSPSLRSMRSSIQRSATFSAMERSGRTCTRSNQWVRWFSTRKKLRQLTFFLSQCRRISFLLLPCRNSSCTPISAGIFLKGFLA